MLGVKRRAGAEAATLAKVKNYQTVNYPAPKSLYEQLLELSDNESAMNEQLKTTLGPLYEPFITVRAMENQSPIQMRADYVIIEN